MVAKQVFFFFSVFIVPNVLGWTLNQFNDGNKDLAALVNEARTAVENIDDVNVATGGQKILEDIANLRESMNELSNKSLSSTLIKKKRLDDSLNESCKKLTAHILQYMYTLGGKAELLISQKDNIRLALLDVEDEYIILCELEFEALSGEDAQNALLVTQANGIGALNSAILAYN